MTLIDFIESYLGKFGEYLGWTVTEFSLIATSTLESYGVDTEDEATDIKKLHSLAKMQAWEKALVELAQDYNYSVDGGSYSRSQVYDAAKQNYLNAVLEALPYLDNYTVGIGELTDIQDPYIDFPVYADRVK
jgi:hypothetical protein